MVLATVVIDATGAAGVAIAAGGEPILSADAVDLAVQGAGVAERPPCGIYVNTDYLLIDPADVVDVTCAIAGAELALPDTAYDSAPLVQTRERRRVRGDHVLDYLDQITGRTYADAVVLSSSDYDSHGYPSLDYFAMLPHSPESLKANHPAPGGAAWTPYRCLLPRGREHLLERLSLVSAWDDRILQGAMAEYAHLPTPVDGLILALGALREPRCLPHLSRLAARLDAESPLSHIRSLARALEALGDPSGATIVTALLGLPGFRGHALHSIVPLHDKPMERRRRLGPLREIVLARALYRLGDPDGFGREILSEYQRDRRGLLAQHATAVLRQGLRLGVTDDTLRT
ncbi:MAG: FAD-dependent oxidoreductase [Lentisphaerae bacterium]|nr:FAD-dependent oxidoreductase [Lentisphaerota bacterium]